MLLWRKRIQKFRFTVSQRALLGHPVPSKLKVCAIKYKGRLCVYRRIVWYLFQYEVLVAKIDHRLRDKRSYFPLCDVTNTTYYCTQMLWRDGIAYFMNIFVWKCLLVLNWNTCIYLPYEAVPLIHFASMSLELVILGFHNSCALLRITISLHLFSKCSLEPGALKARVSKSNIASLLLHSCLLLFGRMYHYNYFRATP